MEEFKFKKRYLGDAVYFDFDGYHVLLTTENGIFATNTIALEPEVIESFQTAMSAFKVDIANHKLKS